ncbi:hypothetical protein [Spartinivicinus ruber]|uniref:hypothetical protein n=1 Tax=Spartinivicinus ruber TaxID=2683272 RepID=UPI0013D0E59E|nr:hypothetical protein [Spartinivicinus ruber]
MPEGWEYLNSSSKRKFLEYKSGFSGSMTKSSHHVLYKTNGLNQVDYIISLAFKYTAGNSIWLYMDADKKSFYDLKKEYIGNEYYQTSFNLVSLNNFSKGLVNKLKIMVRIAFSVIHPKTTIKFLIQIKNINYQ